MTQQQESTEFLVEDSVQVATSNDLHLALLEVQKIVKTDHPATGICDLLGRTLLNKGYDFSVKITKKARDLMREWPEYSGDALFPVPAPEGSCPEACYISAKDLWGFDDYGRARRRLLAWLIERTNHENSTPTA